MRGMAEPALKIQASEQERSPMSDPKSLIELHDAPTKPAVLPTKPMTMAERLAAGRAVGVATPPAIVNVPAGTSKVVNVERVNGPPLSAASQARVTAAVQKYADTNDSSAAHHASRSYARSRRC
jgi:hypothetical protein